MDRAEGPDGEILIFFLPGTSIEVFLVEVWIGVDLVGVRLGGNGVGSSVCLSGWEVTDSRATVLVAV